MNKLAQLSAKERQQLIDDFVDRAFAGIDPSATGAGIAQGMRRLPDLPDDPSAEQVDAWVELVDLIQDTGFQQRVRQMALRGAQGSQPAEGQPAFAINPQLVGQHAGQALADGITPESAEGKAVLDRIVPPETPSEARRQLADDLEAFSDARVERYWQLLGILSGQPPFPPQVPAYTWLIHALRAHAQPQTATPPPAP